MDFHAALKGSETGRFRPMPLKNSVSAELGATARLGALNSSMISMGLFRGLVAEGFKLSQSAFFNGVGP
jgi:hypothetical protein